MKKFELFSEVQIKQWLDQLEVIHENLQANFTFEREMILHESEVCEIL